MTFKKQLSLAAAVLALTLIHTGGVSAFDALPEGEQSDEGTPSAISIPTDTNQENLKQDSLDQEGSPAKSFYDEVWVQGVDVSLLPDPWR